MSVVPVVGVVYALCIFLWTLDKSLPKSVQSEQE